MANGAVSPLPQWASVTVLGGADVGEEPLGTKEKFWVENPQDASPWLFKYARVIDGRVLGEDWAEWLVHQIATGLDLPTAEVRPATCDGRRGIVSKSVVSPTGRLVHGNSLLAEFFPGYETERGRGNPAYTVSAVYDVLEGAGVPPGQSTSSTMTAFDVWAGYLVLDALVAGRDRHHENWGIINDAGNRYIAPSFDHGNALGFQEFDEKRERCLDDPVLMTRWATKGRSHHFAGKPTLVSLAHQALKLAQRPAREKWRIQLDNLSGARMKEIMSSVPVAVMSDVTRSFVSELLVVNRKRLLDDYPVD
jgi:hypothetical protein